MSLGRSSGYRRRFRDWRWWFFDRCTPARRLSGRHQVLILYPVRSPILFGWRGYVTLDCPSCLDSPRVSCFLPFWFSFFSHERIVRRINQRASRDTRSFVKSRTCWRRNAIQFRDSRVGIGEIRTGRCGRRRRSTAFGNSIVFDIDVRKFLAIANNLYREIPVQQLIPACPVSISTYLTYKLSLE